MNDDQIDDLTSLFADAVSDVVPADRLGEIRRATAQAAARKPRRWSLVLAAGTATAAVVAAGALVGQLGPDETPPASDPDRTSRAVAEYFLGDTPAGTRLFREFQSVGPVDDAAARTLAALQLLESDAGADDPDYETAWPAGAFLDVALSDEGIRLTISDEAGNDPAATSTDGVQQAVFTAQAALGEIVPVTFVAGGRTVRDGVERNTAVLSPVNISDPAEGHTVSGILTLRGTARAPGNSVDDVGWELRSTDGKVALSGVAPVTGTAWETTASIADLDAGRYVLTVSIADDNGAATDTRTVTVH